jgi:hypothetical protein
LHFYAGTSSTRRIGSLRTSGERFLIIEKRKKRISDLIDQQFGIHGVEKGATGEGYF